MQSRDFPRSDEKPISMAVSETTGFPPILGDDARVLVLGSLPSVMSVRKGEYYGHPQNAFWKIMGELFGAGPDLDYASRAARLTGAGVAVWDVLAASVRPGSMDADIDPATARPNDFTKLFRDHTSIGLVCFNGQAAARFYQRLVAPGLEKGSNTLHYETLPSTSPAYASVSFADKLQKWRVVRQIAFSK